MKKFYLFLFVWLFCITLTAQTKPINQPLKNIDQSTSKVLADSVQQEWIERYNGPGNRDDGAVAMVVDDSGNVYVTGYSNVSGYCNDYTTIKYTASGNEVWVAQYNGSGNGNDQSVGIVIDDSCNVYVTGYSYELGSGQDYTTIKYGSSGNEKWIAHYNGPGNSLDAATALTIDDSNNLYVTGYSMGSGTSSDYTTIKYNSDGIEKWVARYDGGGYGDKAFAITLDKYRNVYVTGGVTNISNTGSSYGTIKYNSTGNEEWVRLYWGGNYGDAIVVDDSNNVFVTGWAWIYGPFQYLTIKYSSEGNLEWFRHYQSSDGNAYANDIAIDKLGNVYVTGECNNDYNTIKYNTLGQQLWVAIYDGFGNSYDYASALTVDDFNNVYVTGLSSTIKYNSSGTQEWIEQYNGYGTAIVVDDSENVYVTGYSSNGQNDDFATIKYKQISFPTGVKENAKIPLQFSLEQNYPNPFNPTTKISWQSPVGSWLTLIVYDVLGREVATLVNEYKPAGKYEVEFNGNNLTSGIYFYSLQEGNFKQVRKMIIMK